MVDLRVAEAPTPPPSTAAGDFSSPPSATATRKAKRKALKKQKRKLIRRELAEADREELERLANDPEELAKEQVREREEAEAAERERKLFEEREREWLKDAEERRRKVLEEEENRKKVLEEENNKIGNENELEEDADWEYIEDGPAEIIWQGNEIIVKKKRVKVPKKDAGQKLIEEDEDRPFSNPLPSQSAAFASYQNANTQEVLDSVAQQIPHFGTEQDKTHCPFHLKTGACRFGTRCSRVHFHPEKSCTLLIKNMYNGPGLAWEQDEGLEMIACYKYVEDRRFDLDEDKENDYYVIFFLGYLICDDISANINGLYTDEEVERCYEEFYEDVHTEFLKFGELINFKVCRNGCHHLRGNVYVHYKALESAVLAYNTMNGRYFAGKQITCEFVSVTRWKVAICGEYMKSRLKACSRGTACNFIHCFRNPGGEYEWADWDSPPPRLWVRKMAALFGSSEETLSGKDVAMEGWERPTVREVKEPSYHRYSSRRSQYSKRKHQSGSSVREGTHGNQVRLSASREHSSQRRNVRASSTKQTREISDSDDGYDLKHSQQFRDSDDGSEYRHNHKKRKQRNDNSHRDNEKHKAKHEYKWSRKRGEDERDGPHELYEGHKFDRHSTYTDDEQFGSVWHSDNSADELRLSDHYSSGKAYESCIINPRDRYNGTYDRDT